MFDPTDSPLLEGIKLEIGHEQSAQRISLATHLPRYTHSG
jgi:hypothetical protein